METKEAADAAVIDPNPIIDGRKANVNLAYLGVKSRLATPSGIIFLFIFSSHYLVFVKNSLEIGLIPVAIRYQLPTAQAPTYGYVKTNCC